MSLTRLVEVTTESHSPSPQDDERNREYLIRRAALSDNPTKEQMDAVVALRRVVILDTAVKQGEPLQGAIVSIDRI